MVERKPIVVSSECRVLQPYFQCDEGVEKGTYLDKPYLKLKYVTRCLQIETSLTCLMALFNFLSLTNPILFLHSGAGPVLLP